MSLAYSKPFAKKAHKGQKRWGGEDYYETHLLGALKVFITQYTTLSSDPITTADAVVLHDTIEDTNVTYEDLVAKFGSDVAIIVYIVSKKEGEEYYDFIKRIIDSKNPEAILVKLSDIGHNLQNLKKGAMKDKYKLARALLMKSLKEMTEVNMDFGIPNETDVTWQ